MVNAVDKYDFKKSYCNEFCWQEKNVHYSGFERNNFSLKRDNINYDIKIVLIHDSKTISVSTKEDIDIETMYYLVCSLRRFEYLFDGSFYVLEKCLANNRDITNQIREVELGYFRTAKFKHKISWEFSDKDYKRYFANWIKTEKRVGIINQMMLYANHTDGLPADVRLSMTIECFESLINMLQKKGDIEKINKYSERKYICQHCNKANKKTVAEKQTLSDCMFLIIEKYGNIIFKTEYRRKRSLIAKMVQTRNKVFHVNSKKKNTLNGRECGFYAIKLEWLYRYIIFLQLGIDKETIDNAIAINIRKFEEEFPECVY